jgi:AcrR family transcriptional regulator
VNPYEAVSVDDVCEAVGVAHGLVSYHFGGKRGLFTAAVESVANDLLEYERPRQGEVSPSERLRGALRRRFEYARKYPNKVALLLNSHSRDPEIEKFLNALRARTMHQWSMNVGCIDHLDTAPKWRASLSGWLGWLDGVSLEAKESVDVEIEYLIECCVQALVTAVRVAFGLRYDVEAEFTALAMVMNTSAGEPAPQSLDMPAVML